MEILGSISIAWLSLRSTVLRSNVNTSFNSENKQCTTVFTEITAQ